MKVTYDAPAAEQRPVVNGEIPIIMIKCNGLGRDRWAEARHADGPHADRCKQMIAHSALVIHDSKKHRSHQFMNALFVMARCFIEGMVDNCCGINVLCIIRPRFFAGVFAEFQTPVN
jgi:hypothetical protein